jgi:hypothetical protein
MCIRTPSQWRWRRQRAAARFGRLARSPNEGDAIGRLIRKLEGREGLHVCYEAGPCGYVLYWQLAKLGVRCDVVPRQIAGSAEQRRPREQP